MRTSLVEPRAVLWDLDGTIVDTAGLHWLSWREVLAAEGCEATYERFKELFGRRNDVALRRYLGADLPAGEIERISAAKEARFRELVRARGVTMFPGVERWLQRLKAQGWRQAIASSAPRLNAEVTLAALGLEEFFDAVVAAEDVEQGKPDPQVFLLAARRVGAAPERCVVIEDAPAGVEGARRAGMRVIGVLTTHARLEADCVVRTLDELEEGTFERLLQRGASRQGRATDAA